MTLPVVILNAGRGSRLGALTDDRPKCLVDVVGRPFLDWQLDWLQEQGATEVIIATGYRGEQIMEHVRQRSDLEIECSHDGSKILGSARSLSQIVRTFPHETVFVLYGDILPCCSLADVEAAFWATDKPVLMTCHRSERGNIRRGIYSKMITDGPLEDSGLLVGMTAVFETCGTYRNLEDVLYQLSAHNEEVAFYEVERPSHIGTPAELEACAQALARVVVG